MSAAVPSVVVLAAGEGTRMRSATTPKVLHRVGGRSLIGHVLAATSAFRPRLVVVGHGREAVTAEIAAVDPDARAVVQERQDGTGHAVATALAAAPDLTGPVVVTYGDMPLVTPALFERLLAAHDTAGAAITMVSTRLADPTGYGRVVRDAAGAVTAIVEERDATPSQRAIDEVNAGIYAFDASVLRDLVGKLSAANAQGELYLTDVVGLAVDAGLVVAAVEGPADELAGVNDRAQLAAAGATLRDRVNAAWMKAGVTIVDPATTWIDATVTLEPDATVEPFTMLRGATVVRAGAVVGPHADLTDTVVAEGAVVRASTCLGAEVGPGATVGPYTYLRPGTRLGRGAKAGAYVEMKNAEIGDGAKVPHLAYVGDATVGANSNLGAGTVTVNYDGVAKHRTTIGDDVRIGSDTMLVAPVTVGDGAYTAAGSTITQDVPPGALGVGRAHQRNVEGWVARRRGPVAETKPSSDDEGAQP